MRVAKGADEAIAILKKYLVMDKTVRLSIEKTFLVHIKETSDR